MDKGEKPDTRDDSGVIFETNDNSGVSNLRREHYSGRRGARPMPKFFEESMNETPNPIVVNNQNGRKSKVKIVIIVLVVLLLVAAAIALIFYLARGPISEGNFHSKYNKYANYVLYGKDSGDSIDAQYNSQEKYYFYQMKDSKEKQSEIISKTLELADDFYKESGSRDLPEDASVEISKSKELLNLMASVYVKERMHIADISVRYKKEGWDSARNYIDTYYDFSRAEENSLLAGYKDAFVRWSNSVMSIADIADRLGCIDANTGMISHICIEGKAGREALESYKNSFNSMNEAGLEMNSYMDLQKEYIYHLIAINAYLGGNNE